MIHFSHTLSASNRDEDKVSALFQNKPQNPESSNSIPILKANSDIGVRRNHGRSGSRFASESILVQLKKMTSKNLAQVSLYETEVCAQSECSKDFEKSQIDQAKRIQEAFSKNNTKKMVHIGGGHDHIYPLLVAAKNSGFNKIYVWNIDAHCDSRVDEIAHSGTPFKQFSDLTSSEGISFKLVQYGIHPFANSTSTLEAIGPSQHIYSYQEIKNFDFKQIEKEMASHLDSWSDDSLFVLSLDCDAIDSAIMEGVSAVNHQGLTADHIYNLVKAFNKLDSNATKVFGLYEYNPLFDGVNNKGSRFLSSLIYEFALHKYY